MNFNTLVFKTNGKCLDKNYYHDGLLNFEFKMWRYVILFNTELHCTLKYN